MQQYSEIDQNIGRDIGIKKMKKKELLAAAAVLETANDALLGGKHKDLQGLTEMLVQCQDVAIQIGNSLEETGEQYAPVVHLLEDYCENIYRMSISLTEEKTCRKLAEKVRRQLTELQNKIRYEVPEDKKEVVFLPYKASMWDSLESIWKAADADIDCNAYVIPIPYYDKNPDGSFGQMHYEGDQYPDYVPITSYKDYNFEKNRPDVIYIHNPYDEFNYITSVHPLFYSKKLREYTDRLVYIPYFVLGEVELDDDEAVEGIMHFCTVPGVFNADKVIVQSEKMRQIYVNVLTKAAGKNTRGMWEEKILGIGSPKFDKVSNTRKEDLEIPAKWQKIIGKPDGSRKKVIFYNTGINALLRHNEDMIKKMQNVFGFFKEHQDEMALLWRPHPLIQATVSSMRPKLWVEYEKILIQYKEEGWGIYDDTADLNRAIEISDAYYGDASSVVQLYQQTGKPVMIQNVENLG